MYDIFEKLLKETGCKAADVAKGTGIHPSTFSDWKKGKSVPKPDKMMKIAKFFNVPLEYLYGNSDVRLDEETIKSDMSAFAAYLKQLGWNVSLITEDSENYYSIDNGQVFINVSSEKYLAFENKIRKECIDGILGFLTESLSNYDVGVFAAHHTVRPELGVDDSPEKDQQMFDED